MPEEEPAPPTIDGFYAYIGKGKLMGVRCASCGRLLVPPRPVCPSCYGTDVEWVELSGEGVVESYTIIHVAPPRFQEEAPYIVAIVRLREGVRLPGRLVGAKPEDVKVGMPVKVEFVSEASEEGWPYWPTYRFRPA